MDNLTFLMISVNISPGSNQWSQLEILVILVILLVLVYLIKTSKKYTVGKIITRYDFSPSDEDGIHATFKETYCAVLYANPKANIEVAV